MFYEVFDNINKATDADDYSPNFVILSLYFLFLRIILLLFPFMFIMIFVLRFKYITKSLLR